MLFVCLQLVANTVLFTSVNLSGLFVRILTERAQRKAFLQARNCIEERLRMEDENEKQVRASTRTRLKLLFMSDVLCVCSFLPSPPSLSCAVSQFDTFISVRFHTCTSTTFITASNTLVYDKFDCINTY